MVSYKQDTNTTYSSGNGINLSGTEFTGDVTGGDGLTQERFRFKNNPKSNYCYINIK